VVTPAIYDVDVAHVRASPIRHEVRARSYQWFVDLDDLPRLPLLASFRARDHLGDPARSIRANVDAFLAESGIDLRGGAVTMLANARSFGYVFNPLSLFWCHDTSGELVCVIAEVHNTYGGRHCYLIHPDDTARAETEKVFYVSPFYPVDGHYRMHVPEPGERLAITITLQRGDDRPFVATVRGVRRSGRLAGALAAALGNPLATWKVRAAIARHGITLYFTGLPVQPRPEQDSETHMRKPTVAGRLAGLFEKAVAIPLPLRLRAWDGSEAGPADGPVLIIRSRRALRRIAWNPGELGLARAYVSGELDVEGDLADGFRRVWSAARAAGAAGADSPHLGLTDRVGALGSLLGLGAFGPRPQPPKSEARVTGRRHTRERDRAAIAHHYDLSNDFYQLILDQSMAYSSAYFEHDGQPLGDAQSAKLEHVCRKLALAPGDRLLDVGCGWGSLILHAAEKHGVRCTGVTLSAQQRDFVAKRIADRGLDGLVTVRLQDYRELAEPGAYDAVSSIEMGEHVGESQYPTYAASMFDALRPGGRLLLQQMSRRADAAPGGGAFIERYIAPDMHMRPLPETLAFLERAGFEVRDVEALREHYVRTVDAWIETVERNYPAVVDLVGEEVARVWRLYLVGGRLSFEEGRMGVDQILAVKTVRGGAGDMPLRRSRTA